MPYLQEFCESLRGRDFLILDTETTGLNEGEICEISIIDSKGEILLDARVKTKNPIPKEATAIHGISDSMVENMLTWPEIQKIVLGLTVRQNVIVYNAVYDRRMMHQSDRLWGLIPAAYKEQSAYFCCMEAYADYYGDWNSYRGSYTWQSLAKAYKLVTRENHAGAHGALADCIATLAVTRFLLDKEHIFDRLDNLDNREIDL